ncbi:MAG TPA: hypothetical protein VE620_00345 [Myxococcales bacterium]|jgi:hypothetical protein|nr:hypothetical protein [Myxococcales bacterium]
MKRVAAALALLIACGGMKDPGSVADKFVDRYYVESDQQGAMPFAAGVAALRLQDELRLTREARAPGVPYPSRQVRVYYTRSALTGDGAERTAEYKLDIRPQGGGKLQREAHLTLARQQDGTWRVVRFHETQPSQ